jgi:hypothetical protein
MEELQVTLTFTEDESYWLSLALARFFEEAHGVP